MAVSIGSTWRNRNTGDVLKVREADATIVWGRSILDTCDWIYSRAAFLDFHVEVDGETEAEILLRQHMRTGQVLPE